MSDHGTTPSLGCEARGHEECMAIGACGESGRCVRASVNHRVPSQAAQSLAVCGPVGSGVGRDAGVTVQVYALGAGVTLVGDGCNLARTQGAFELEANGKIFVFDEVHGAVVEADRFVAAVEGDIAAIGLSIEAVDEKELTKFGFGVGHGLVLPEKTAILTLPQGLGKTTLARSLAPRIGCARIVDGWRPALPITRGALHLTDGEVAA